ncbi:hypothetical protein AWB76_00189 [Caballeronia temeraria]|uniref:Uncharacterized protein n=1 Tax=Caballeronia temeraria TaxID=1777137 RepID=A0A157Z4Y4_9BURK|nr:hypothetical protein [Caballeronia temeraria]SAK40601.1 hypothetical protein AWB76_00189 [Caballeronia temeraria]
MSAACSIDWKLLLEYLKVFLSWPVIVGLCIFAASRRYSEEIKALINRIASLEFMGGKLVTQQEKVEAEQGVDGSDSIAAPSVPELEGLHLSPEQVVQIRNLFAAEGAAARIWEYRYMNYFFAPATQHALDWMISLNAGTTRNAYDAFWSPRVPAAAERDAMIVALERHQCIVLDGPAILVTDKGREYAAWPERRILSVVATPFPTT